MTELQEKLAENNINLAYHVANKFINTSPFLNSDDITSAALLGLVKASNNWEEKRVKFSTYAYIIILNEVLMEVRKHKNIVKHTVSLDSTVDGTINSDSFIFLDVLEDTININPEDIICGKTFFSINEIINKWKVSNPQKEIIIEYFIKNTKQKDIAKEHNITYSYVNRVINKFINFSRPIVKTYLNPI